jgi:hypothetical protein
LAHVLRAKSQTELNRVVNYHAQNGLLVNGQNVAKPVVAVFKNELCLVRTIKLVTAWLQISLLVPRIVGTYHAQCGLPGNGQNVQNPVMVVLKREL